MSHRSAKISVVGEINHVGMLTVEEFRDKLITAVEQPLREGKIELPPNLRKRVPSQSSDMVPQVIFENTTQMIIPLSTDARLRDKYNSYLNVLRMGRLLEDIDMCAARTAIEHAKQLIDPETGRFPLVVVTALIDRIVFKKPILPSNRDIRLTGYVSCVGRSSVEVTLKVEQQRADVSLVPQSAALPEGGAVKTEPSQSTSSDASDQEPKLVAGSADWDHVLQARVVMVALHPENHRPVPFVPLCAKPDDEVGQKAILEGQERSSRRRTDAERSLLKTVPNAEETQLIHNLFLQTVDDQKMTFQQRVKPANTVWISETTMKTVLICHVEERNIYNKIFGGFLMRQALEIAWVTVRHFAFEYPFLIAVDELVFKHPVELGSTLFLSSNIVYKPPSVNHLVVRVNIEVSNIDSSTHVEKRLVTNTAYFIYGIIDSDVKMRDVYPETYAESMMYLDGKRHYEEVMNEAKSSTTVSSS